MMVEYRGPERRAPNELLIRIDERLKTVQADVGQLKIDVAAVREVQTRFDPEQFVPRFSKTTREWEEFKLGRKIERRVLVVIASGVATLITLLLSPLATTLATRMLR